MAGISVRVGCRFLNRAESLGRFNGPRLRRDFFGSRFWLYGSHLGNICGISARYKQENEEAGKAGDDGFQRFHGVDVWLG